MAANLKLLLNFDFSRILFRNNEDFNPKIFFVNEPSNDLNIIIKKGGGFITDNASEADVLLCEKRTDPLINDGYFPFSFITDCIMKNAFLNIDKYRAEVLGLKPSTSNDNNETGNNSDEDVLGPVESTRVRIYKDDFKGRKKYTHSDDLNIIKYLINHDVYTRTGGNVVWKQMESFQVTQHTFQSMKARFKLILNHIDSYNVPEHWKTKLKGLHENKSKSCGLSAKDLEEQDVEDPLFSALDERKSKKTANLKFKTKRRNRNENAEEVQVDQSMENSDDDQYVSSTGSGSPVLNISGSSSDSVSSLRLSLDAEIQQDVLPSFGSISPVKKFPGNNDGHEYETVSDESISPIRVLAEKAQNSPITDSTTPVRTRWRLRIQEDNSPITESVSPLRTCQQLRVHGDASPVSESVLPVRTQRQRRIQEDYSPVSVRTRQRLRIQKDNAPKDECVSGVKRLRRPWIKEDYSPITDSISPVRTQEIRLQEGNSSLKEPVLPVRTRRQHKIQVNTSPVTQPVLPVRTWRQCSTQEHYSPITECLSTVRTRRRLRVQEDNSPINECISPVRRKQKPWIQEDDSPITDSISPVRTQKELRLQENNLSINESVSPVRTQWQHEILEDISLIDECISPARTRQELRLQKDNSPITDSISPVRKRHRFRELEDESPKNKSFSPSKTQENKKCLSECSYSRTLSPVEHLEQSSDPSFSGPIFPVAISNGPGNHQNDFLLDDFPSIEKISEESTNHQNSSVSEQSSSLQQTDDEFAELAAEATVLRRVEFLTKHLKLTKLEALYLLKGFHGDLVAALTYLNDS